jgi:hypothetical protein
LHKEFSKTDYYFCISFHNDNDAAYATLLGFINKNDVLVGKIGDIFLKGTQRIREDSTSFTFQRDTYEIMFKHITPPFVSEQIKQLPGFKRIDILPGHRENNKY